MPKSLAKTTELREFGLIALGRMSKGRTGEI